MCGYQPRVTSRKITPHSVSQITQLNEQSCRPQYETGNLDTAQDQPSGPTPRAATRSSPSLEPVTTYAYSVTVHDGASISTSHGSGCQALTGFTPEDFAADPTLWIAMVHPDDRDCVARHAAGIVGASQLPAIEHRIICKDQTVRWVRNTVVLHHDHAGHVDRYDGLFEDITERKRVQEELAANLLMQGVVASLLHLALETISLKEQLERSLDVIVAVPWLQSASTGCIFLASKDSTELLMTAQHGLPSNILRTCHTVQMGTCVCGQVAVARRPIFSHSSDRCHEIRYLDMPIHGQYCVPIICGDRLYGILNVWVCPEYEPLPEHQEFLTTIAELLAGTISHRLDQEALLKSEERFDLAVRGTHAGIWDWDLLTNDVYFSPRWKSMLGYNDEEIGGGFSEWESRLHPGDRERALKTIRDYFDGTTETYELEHRLRHKDGSYRWILARGAVVRESDGVPRRMVGSHLDITERKESERRHRQRLAQLIAAQEVQERLLPASAPGVPGFDIAGAVIPAEFTAGDFFDYLHLHDGSLAIIVGDVSGHGFGPALLATSLDAHLRSLSEGNADMGELLRLTNSVLCSEVDRGGFATLVTVVINISLRTLQYANAGHPSGYLFDRSGDVKGLFESTTLPLGLASEWECRVSDPISLDSGDIVLLTSDGITEAGSPCGQRFGRERMLEVVRAHRDLAAGKIVEGIHQAVQHFSQSEKPKDDLTTVVVKVEPPATC